MRDEEGNRVTAPICLLKDEYYAAIKQIWGDKGLRITQITKEILAPYMEAS